MLKKRVRKALTVAIALLVGHLTSAGAAKALVLCLIDGSCTTCYLYDDNGNPTGWISNCP